MAPTVDAHVSLTGVAKSYAFGEGRIDVLRGLSLELERSQTTAIMGPSGVGKSTLLNCIAGLDVADAGAIRIGGTDVAQLDDRNRTIFRRKNMGIIFQFFNLVPNLTVQENVGLPYLIDETTIDDQSVAEILERVGMAHRRTHLPSQLSGGEMQLATIARALVRVPNLLLADEPTGNVNVATGKKIMTLLSEVVAERETSLLLVTHNPEDAARADRVLFLKDGVVDPALGLTGEGVTSDAIHKRLGELGI